MKTKGPNGFARLARLTQDSRLGGAGLGSGLCKMYANPLDSAISNGPCGAVDLGWRNEGCCER